MKLLVGLLKIIAFIVILFFSIWAIEELVYHNIRIPKIRKSVMVISFICIGIISFILNNYFTKEDDINEFKREIEYLKNNIWTPLFWGGGLALIFISVNALFYEGENNFVEANIFEISSILIGTISTIIIFRGIFQGIAPISSIERFLLLAAEDLKRKRYDRTGRVWLIYPALNIGYYREQIDEVPTKHYSEFKESLNIVKNNPKVQLTVVTFPSNLYKPLYQEYVKMNNKPEDDPNIDKCVNEALDIFNSCSNGNHSNCTSKEVSPEKFPNHCLIVDNVVYLINTFGLPDYNPSDNKFHPLNNTENHKEKLAKVFIYRQEDKILADLLIDKIKNTI